MARRGGRSVGPRGLRERTASSAARYPHAMGCGSSTSVVKCLHEPCLAGMEAHAGFHMQYAFEGRIGKGSFGSVYAAQRMGNKGLCERVAVKVVDLRLRSGRRRSVHNKMRRVAEQEIAIMLVLPRCPHLVCFHDFYDVRDMVYIVMEYCGSRLLTALEPMPTWTEKTLKIVLRQMLLAIDALHRACIVHRDIKPDNFLVDDTPTAEFPFIVKLCDFGVAGTFDDVDSRELSGMHGTLPFMALEVLNGSRSTFGLWALWPMLCSSAGGRTSRPP